MQKIFTSKLTQAKSSKEALSLLGQMKQRNIPLNLFHYNAAIKACGKERKWNDIVSLLGEMKRIGLEPNHVTYVTVMKAYSSAGLWQKALGLRLEMQANGIVSNI